MPTVLNNTERHFMAFYNTGTPLEPLLQRAQVGPGFTTVSERDLRILKTDAHFIKACDLGLVIVNAGVSDVTEEKQEVTPLEIAEISAPKPAAPDILPEVAKPKRKRRKKKKVEDTDFGDFE